MLVALGRWLRKRARCEPRLFLGTGEENMGRSVGYGVCDRDEVALPIRPGGADMAGDGLKGACELRE